MKSKCFYRIKFEVNQLLAIQSDFKRLFNDILLKKVLVEEKENAFFLVPFEKVDPNFYPILYQWMNTKSLKEILNVTFRFLWTDPNQFHPDTASKKFDRYIPHRELPSAALNIPVENCDKHTTLYWHTIDITHKGVTKIPNGYLLHQESDDTICKSVIMTMNKPLLIRTDVFHSVKNLGSKKRIVASCHIKKGIDWNTIVKYLLENNIIEEMRI